MSADLAARIRASHARTRRDAVAWLASRELDETLPADPHLARQRLQSDAPTAPRQSMVTGLVDEGPWDVAHAIGVLARAASSEPETRDLVQRALRKHGPTLTWRCIPEITGVLGQDAEHALHAVLDLDVYGVLLEAMQGLNHLDHIRPSTVAQVARALERSLYDNHNRRYFARWIRHRLAHEPELLKSLRDAARARDVDAPCVEHAIRAADLDLDERMMTTAWDHVRGHLPPFAFDSIEIDARRTGSECVSFLVADQTRCFVPGLDFQVFAGCDPPIYSGETQALRTWRLPLATPEHSLVLVVPVPTGWSVALDLVADNRMLATLIHSLERTESWLRLPQFAHVDSRDGMRPCSIDGHPSAQAFRIGALGIDDVDRPFVIVVWDDAHETSLGVALVDARAFVE